MAHKLLLRTLVSCFSSFWMLHAVSAPTESCEETGTCSEGSALLQTKSKTAAQLATADCDVSDCLGCEVFTLIVEGVTRCYTLYIPTTKTRPPSGWPVMIYFHGMGGAAKQTCTTKPTELMPVTNTEYAEEMNFALVCADSDEDWQFPQVKGGLIVTGQEAGNTKDADPGVGLDNRRPCTEMDTPDAKYVETILDTIGSNVAFDAKKIYFMGFSQGAMMTAWASTCFAHRIKGVVQAGSGLKIQGDGNSIPGDACQTECNTCEFFPIEPGSKERPLYNVEGEPLKWCQYAGCSDYLIGSILSMDQYLTSIGAPHSLQYYDASHIAPTAWFPMIAQCHGWSDIPASAGSEAHWLASCPKPVSIPAINGSGCNAQDGGDAVSGGGGGGGGVVVLSCSQEIRTRCCGDGTCDGPENTDNCAADCGGDGGGGGGVVVLSCSQYLIRTRCCGDGTCDLPENAHNCAADCGGQSNRPWRQHS